MRESHYAISCISLKISYVFTYKINITSLLFPYVLERVASIRVQKYRKNALIVYFIGVFFDFVRLSYILIKE